MGGDKDKQSKLLLQLPLTKLNGTAGMALHNVPGLSSSLLTCGRVIISSSHHLAALASLADSYCLFAFPPAQVVSMTPGSAAELAGVHIGDVIVAINEHDVQAAPSQDVEQLIATAESEVASLLCSKLNRSSARLVHSSLSTFLDGCVACCNY
jgi:membrane-associated protease RseP (regulator of RpoE activity)